MPQVPISCSAKCTHMKFPLAVWEESRVLDSYSCLCDMAVQGNSLLPGYRFISLLGNFVQVI